MPFGQTSSIAAHYYSCFPQRVQNCAPCHGARGEGTDKAKSLRTPASARGATEVGKVIREGIAGTTMFAFGEVLSAAEIETLARHVGELRRP